MTPIRSRKHNPARLAALIAATLPFAVHAADEPSKARSTTLPTVNVEAADEPRAAYKAEQASNPQFTEPLLDTPLTVNVITEELIRDQAVDNLRDVLRNVPGISIQAGEGGVPAGDNLSIRGFNARTDIFIDGVRDFGGYSRDPFNLEQVEVIKGPASTYAGRGSTGGSVNLVSKSAKTENFSYLNLGVGTDSYKRLTADLNRKLNDTTAVRLNLMGHDADTPGRDEVFNSRAAFAPTISFGLNTPTRVSLSYFFMKQDNLPDYGIPWVPNTNTTPELANYLDKPAPVDFDNFYGLTARDYEDITTHVATAEVEHDVSTRMSVRNITRFGHNYRDSIVTAPRFASNNSTDIRRTDEKSRDEVNAILSNLTTLNYSFATGDIGHTLVAGLELAHERAKNFLRPPTGPDSQNTDLFNPDPSDPYTDNLQRDGTFTRGDANSVAVFVGDNVQLSERWELNGGLRWDRYSIDYQPDTGAELSRTDNEWSWRAGVVYKPAENGSIYLGYGTSFNPAAEGLNLGTRVDRSNFFGVDPEENRSIELGTKWELMRGRVLATAALFRTDKTNARTQDPADNTDFIVLEGEQRVQGVELSLGGQITKAWQAYAGYVFMDSEILASKDPAEVGNELSNTPENTFNLWTTYDLSPALRIGGGAQFVDERFSNFSNARKAPDFWLYSAMASYQVNDRFGLQLNLNNITDERYIDAVGGGHFVPGVGRNAVLNLSINL